MDVKNADKADHAASAVRSIKRIGESVAGLAGIENIRARNEALEAYGISPVDNHTVEVVGGMLGMWLGRAVARGMPLPFLRNLLIEAGINATNSSDHRDLGVAAPHVFGPKEIGVAQKDFRRRWIGTLEALVDIIGTEAAHAPVTDTTRSLTSGGVRRRAIGAYIEQLLAFVEPMLPAILAARDAEATSEV